LSKTNESIKNNTWY